MRIKDADSFLLIAAVRVCDAGNFAFRCSSITDTIQSYMKLFALLVMAGGLAWACRSAIVSPIRKNIIAAIVLALVFGTGLGFQFAMEWYIPKLQSSLAQGLRGLADSQYYATALSLTALKQLDSGMEDKARSMLAGQVAGYYRNTKKAKEISGDQENILKTIEETAAGSEILRQKLDEPPK
jgi:hypothetical protein